MKSHQDSAPPDIDEFGAEENEAPPFAARRAAHLSIDALARYCADELQGLGARPDATGAYGFELLRRAVVDESAAAAAVAQELYAPLVQRWITQHQRFSEAGAGGEAIVQAAFQNFFGGVDGRAFARFGGFAGALSYLKVCVHAAIAAHLRQQARTVCVRGANELDALPRPSARTEELWRNVCRILPDPRDQLLARCVFALGMGPRDIAAAYGDYWSSAREVASALARMRRALRAAPELIEQVERLV